MKTTTPGKAIAKLAELVSKEQGVRVAFSQTNGRDCIHITRNERMDKPVRLSYTIYEQVEWDQHEWNSAAKVERKDANADVLAAVANREAI